MRLFNAAVDRKIFQRYLLTLQRVAAASKLDPKNLLVSTRAFGNALKETKMDCEFLRQRRPLRHGLSRGKVIGALIFRLCRNPVLSFTPACLENPLALRAPVEIALALGLELVEIDPNAMPENLCRELKFYLAKRHINQEALGICFDTLKWTTH